VTFAAMLDFKRSFTRVQNEENLCYNLHIKNCVNYYLGFEVRRENPFQGNGAFKVSSSLLLTTYLEHGFQQLLISKLSLEAKCNWRMNKERVFQTHGHTFKTGETSSFISI